MGTKKLTPPKTDGKPSAKAKKPTPPAEAEGSVAAAKFKFPKTLAGCADRLFEIRAHRLAQQKLVDAIEAEEQALKAHLIEQLPKDHASGVAGRLARVSLVVKTVPQVEDWDAFYAAIKQGEGTEGFALLGRSLGKAAIEERWEAGQDVPGVKPFPVTTLSINKV